MADHLSRRQARRIALAAQGFADRPHQVPTMRTFDRTVRRTGVLQIDSVNVLQRAHYMPLYSRMGAYDIDLLRRATEKSPRRMVEYWAHVAAFMPVDLWPHMRHRMRFYRHEYANWEQVRAKREVIAGLLDRITDLGPSTARQLDESSHSSGGWWDWSETKQVLEYLFFTGDLAIAGRTTQFERRYDLAERVIPPQVLAQPDPSPGASHRELARRAAQSYGVATVKQLADYYRMRVAPTTIAVRELVEAGELRPVTVEGSATPHYLHTAARIPRRIAASTVLSPFDPIVWFRERTEHLFDFHYRIEIYTPEHKRIHGYYVLPFLLGEQIVARLDLKADRPTRRLLVKAAHNEPGAPADTAAHVATELARLAGWLGLDTILVEPRGSLAPALTAEIR